MRTKELWESENEGIARVWRQDCEKEDFEWKRERKEINGENEKNKENEWERRMRVGTQNESEEK